MLTDVIAFVVVILIMSVALVTDLKHRTIPNLLTVSGAVGGLVYHLVTGGLDGLLFSLGGFATGFGLLLLLWLCGNGGGGDVKLMGAVGAWLGAFATLIVFIGSALAAVFGSSTGTPTVSKGAATMKMINSTSITSTNGVTLISDIGFVRDLRLRPRRPPLDAP